MRHKLSVWTNWYAVHGHTLAALHSHTHTSWLSFWVQGHCGVKMMPLRHSWGWPPPQTASLIHIRCMQVFEHIDMLSMGIQYQPYTVIPTVLSSVFGFRVIYQERKKIKLSVCLSVCLCVCVSVCVNEIPMLHVYIYIHFLHCVWMPLMDGRH